jgi:transcriptional regulator with XRE-family HTH domain
MSTAAGIDSGVAFASLRTNAGYSRRRLAAMARVDVSSVGRVERGRYVRREVRDKLVAVLGEDARSVIRVRYERPPTDLYLARIARGESSRAAARRAGVSKDAFARAERGQPIRQANAERIAAAFELTERQLLTLVLGRRAA